MKVAFLRFSLGTELIHFRHLISILLARNQCQVYRFDGNFIHNNSDNIIQVVLHKKIGKIQIGSEQQEKHYCFTLLVSNKLNLSNMENQLFLTTAKPLIGEKNNLYHSIALF